MKAAIIEKIGQIHVKDVSEPSLAADEVLIKVFSSGVCGTDIHIYHGGFGDNFPVIPGHEFAGEVMAVGKDCKRINVGARVAVEPNIPCNNCHECLSGRQHHCTHMIVPGVNCPGGMAGFCKVKEVGVFPIDDLAYEAGAFVEPLSCVLHGISRIKPQNGERCLILGAGPIGVQLAWVASSYGFAQIDFLEKNDFRRNFVKKYQYGDCYKDLSQIQYKNYDAILDATGATALISQVLEYLRAMGRLLIFGVPSPENKLQFNHYDIFRREISIIGSYTSLKDSMKAIALLKNKAFPIEELITDYITLAALPQMFEEIIKAEKDIMKVMVLPNK